MKSNLGKLFIALLLLFAFALSLQAASDKFALTVKRIKSRQTPQWRCPHSAFQPKAKLNALRYSRSPLSLGELRLRGKISPAGKILSDTLGEQRTFWAADFTNYPTSYDYYQITATLRRIGQHCYIYLQDGQHLEDPLEQLTEDEILDIILNEFDNNIYPNATSVFGSEWNPGIDGDSHITLLLLDIRDGYPAKELVVAGYFDPDNEYSKDKIPHSNEEK